MKSFLGLPDANDKILRLAKIMGIIGPLANISFTLSTTFYVIFVAEALGGGPGMYLQGIGLVGTLVVTQMVIQIIFDYPTGAIGDWIGQRYILASANVSFGVAFLMVSFVTVDTPYIYLVAVYALQGFSQSQSSGAWGAWFDNNYRVAMPGDTDRKQYGVFWGRMGMIMAIMATAALIPGSILAAVFTRAWVFQFQGILAFVFAILVFRLVRDFPEIEQKRAENGTRPELGEYLSILRGGVSYLFRHAFVRYIAVGSMLAVSSIMVWGNLILFPMYYLYLITDVGVASFRTLLFIPGIFSQERSGIWSRRFEPKKWIPRFRLMQTCGLTLYWPLTSIELLTIPMENILPIALIFLTFVSTSFFGGFAEILTQRVLLDVIPNRIRNSMYSLFPTIATLFAIPQIALFGWLITIIGFPMTLAACGTVSFIGVLFLVHGFRHEPPEPDGETWANGDAVLPPEESATDEVEEISEEIHLED